MAPAIDPAVEKALTSAQTNLRAGKFAPAVDDYTQVLTLDPKNTMALLGRSFCYAGLSDFLHADADMATAASVMPAGSIDLFTAESSIYTQEKKFPKAVAALTQAIALAPKRVDLWISRGDSYAQENQYDAAYGDYTQAIILQPDSADAYFSRAILLNQQHRTEEAMSDISQAILLNPEFAAAFDVRAELEGKLGNQQANLADLKTALKLEPKSAGTLNNMAWFLAICPDPTKRNGAEAVKDATQACTLSEWKDGASVDTLAAAYAEVGRFDEAVATQQKAITLSKGTDDIPEMNRRLELYQGKKPYHEAEIDPKTIAWESVRYQAFSTVWQTVNDAYYDTNFGGVDWAKVREKYRARLPDIKDNEALRDLLRSMLGELHRTHFAIIPREGAVFNPSERVRIGTAGADLTFTNGATVVAEVDPGSAAVEGGLKPGDTVVTVNGKELAPVAATLAKAGVSPTRAGLYLNQYVESFLTGAVGTKVTLQVKSPTGLVHPVTLTCAPNAGEWSEPIGYFPSLPIRVEARHEADNIDVLKFNAFVPPVMKQIRAFMKTVQPTDGLIIDLRDNGGGISVMASGIAGLLCREEFSMGTMHMRDGAVQLEVYPQAHIFDGPVAVLIDRGSASTSEIFAAGIKESHRAQVFGEPSPGMALPSLFKSLPTGDLFQYAIADVTTPTGITIEGTGVQPNQVVYRTREDLAAGRDPVLEAAKAWIHTQLKAVARVSP